MNFLISGWQTKKKILFLFPMLMAPFFGLGETKTKEQHEKNYHKLVLERHQLIEKLKQSLQTLREEIKSEAVNGLKSDLSLTKKSNFYLWISVIAILIIIISIPLGKFLSLQNQKRMSHSQIPAHFLKNPMLKEKISQLGPQQSLKLVEKLNHKQLTRTVSFLQPATINALFQSLDQKDHQTRNKLISALSNVSKSSGFSNQDRTILNHLIETDSPSSWKNQPTKENWPDYWKYIINHAHPIASQKLVQRLPPETKLINEHLPKVIASFLSLPRQQQEKICQSYPKEEISLIFDWNKSTGKLPYQLKPLKRKICRKLEKDLSNLLSLDDKGDQSKNLLGLDSQQ